MEHIVAVKINLLPLLVPDGDELHIERCGMSHRGAFGAPDAVGRAIGEFNQIEWQSANFTHCDLTNSDLGELNIRKVNLDGVKIDCGILAAGGCCTVR